MLLEFNEGEEGDRQEIPQATAPKGEEQTPEELLECPDHCLTSFLKGKPQSILSPPDSEKLGQPQHRSNCIMEYDGLDKHEITIPAMVTIVCF